MNAENARGDMTAMGPMEPSRDELRRDLRELDAEHRETLPRWRETLLRALHAEPGSGARPDSGAASGSGLGGLSDRRRFLTAGGLAVVGAAVVSACAAPEDGPVPVTGTLPIPPEQGTTTTTTPEEGQISDVTLLRTAQSVEVLAVDVYQQALDAGLLTTPEIADAARLFQQQHRDHAELVAELTQEAGGVPYDQPNPYLVSSVVEIALPDLTSEEAAVSLAYELENTAAQTYVYAAELLSTAAMRQAVMSIGSVEARHLSVLYQFQNLPAAPVRFMPRRARVPQEGMLPQKQPPLTPVAMPGQ